MHAQEILTGTIKLLVDVYILKHVSKGTFGLFENHYSYTYPDYRYI